MKSKTKAKMSKAKPNNKTPKKVKFNFFRNKSKFQLIAFLVVFGLVGSFFVVRTFAATSQMGGKDCRIKFCNYPVELKTAFWINNLRRQYTPPPNQYLPLDDCLSSYARGWAAHIRAVGMVHSNFGYSCGNWVKRGEVLWSGFCQNLAVADAALAEKNADDCAWKAVNDPAGSFLHDHQPGEPHFQVVKDPAYNRQGVGATQDFRTGITWIVVEFLQLR